MSQKHLIVLFAAAAACAQTPLAEARRNGERFDAMAARMDNLLRAWLTKADPQTLLLPDRFPGGLRGAKPGDPARVYTPHNSGADLYPYLILTSHLTAPDLYRGRMMEMLRNEIRYTTADGAAVPGNFDFVKRELGPPSLFGAAEYAKDGLLAVTELLGRTPWFHRMVEMTADLMRRAPVDSRFGKLPADDAELNGDVLQTLARLIPMTRDPRFLEWARRIADAYIDEVLPGNHGVPSGKWDFAKHTGDRRLRLRDHGNETVVGLTLIYALEQEAGSPRAPRYKQAIGRMLDRILASANEDGMLYNTVDSETLKPIDRGLSDNWGYVYGAVYTYYQITGEAKYRDAVLRVLKNLSKYRKYNWESGSFDGYADAIESALYLVAREPVPEALAWIESEIDVMAAMQQPTGFVEHWYGEGNFNRTLLLYILMKSQGCRPDRWVPGVKVGAVQQDGRLHLSVQAPASWNGLIQFDNARHRRVIGYAKNYVRLNEFPEWFTVDENRLYRVRQGAEERVYAGSELIAGVPLGNGAWTIGLWGGL